MKFFRYFRPSSLLITLSCLILVLGLFLAYVVRLTVEDLGNDASMINNAGLIRGGVQQLTKLTFSEPGKDHAVKIAEIDFLVENMIASILQEQDHEKMTIDVAMQLGKDWQELKQRIESYRGSRSETTAHEIFQMSELGWERTNRLVYLLQQATEKKVENISRIFYLLIVLNVISASTVLVIILLAVRNHLEYETAHDDLTSLLNRRSYDRAMASELARNARYQLPVSLILFDIDHFKQINDVHGHRAGDTVLKQLANLVKESVRQIDTVYRVGGEEFAIICPETVCDGAYQLAEKIRREVELMTFEAVGHVTISLGVAECCRILNAGEFYQNADKALYLAKNNGRNRTEVYN